MNEGSESGPNGAKTKVIVTAVVTLLVLAAFALAWLSMRAGDAVFDIQPEPLSRFGNKRVEITLRNGTENNVKIGSFLFPPGTVLIIRYDPGRKMAEVRGTGRLFDTLSEKERTLPASDRPFPAQSVQNFLHRAVLPPCRIYRFDPTKAAELLRQTGGDSDRFLLAIEASDGSDQSATYIGFLPTEEGRWRLTLTEQKKRNPELSTLHVHKGLRQFECTLGQPSAFLALLSSLIDSALPRR